MLSTTSHPITQPTSSLRLRKAVLYANGTFLTLMGGFFAIFDLLSYFFGAGPLGQMVYQEGLAVGLFEAHGLAFIFGLLLLRAARYEPRPLWHLTGAGVHLLLGTSNLLFWAFVIEQNAVGAEIVVTSIHWLFVVAQLFCLWKARTEQ